MQKWLLVQNYYMLKYIVSSKAVQIIQTLMQELNWIQSRLFCHNLVIFSKLLLSVLLH